MSIVIMTKGLPASGKSTWARQWVKERPGRVRINRDDLRMMMQGATKQLGTGCESLVLAASLNILENALRLGRDVVLDNTNLNPQTVKQFTEVCERHGARVEWKVFSTSLEECIERDSQREQPVGAETILTMWRKHQKELTAHRTASTSEKK